MPHGSPDWWGNIPSETVHGGLDTSELAVRLGSIVTFDRRGNVIFLDDFEGSLSSWIVAGGGASNAVYLGCEVTLQGSLAVVLHPGEENDGHASIRLIRPYPVLGGLGFEAAFVPQTNLKHVNLSLILYDGAQKHGYQTRYDHVNGQIKVQATGGTYPVVGTPGVQAEGYHNFCIMKLVVNCLTGQYERVLFNNHVYDASAHSVYTLPDEVTKPLMAAYILVCNTGVYPVNVPVDCAIITQNEPI